MTALYTRNEVKKALFSIHGCKAPSTDGFGFHFYNDVWHIDGNDVTDAVLDVLQRGKMLKEMNTIVIKLILITKCPSNVF